MVFTQHKNVNIAYFVYYGKTLLNFYGFSLSSSEKPKHYLPISGNPTGPGGRFVCLFLSNSSKQTAVARKPAGAKYRIECKAPILK